MAIEPDLLAFLAAVRPPLLTAISTNRTSTMAAVLDTFELRPHFDLVVTALDVERPKPHPEALLKILATFGVSAAEGIFVGDTQVDVDHAAAVGMPLIAFRSPGLQAAYHVSSFREVLRAPAVRPPAPLNARRPEVRPAPIPGLMTKSGCGRDFLSWQGARRSAMPRRTSCTPHEGATRQRRQGEKAPRAYSRTRCVEQEMQGS